MPETKQNDELTKRRLAEMEKREREWEVLLTLSNDLATVRDKDDLLNLINIKLKKIFHFTHSVVSLFNAGDRTFTNFLLDPNSQSKLSPGYTDYVQTPQPSDDGIYDVVLNSEVPLVFQLEKLVTRTKAPGYIRINWDNGTKELIAVSLRNLENKIGVIAFFSDTLNSADSHTLSIIHGVSHQLSTAIANIIANEEIKEREREKTVLLSFSNKIATVRSKEDLSKLINESLKHLHLIKEYIISSISEDGKTHQAFLFDPDAPFTKHPDFVALANYQYQVADKVMEVVVRSDEPVIFEIDELMKMVDVPIYIPFWKAIGLTFVTGVPLLSGNRTIAVLWIQPDQINNHILTGVSAQIAIAISNILANSKIEQQLAEINKYKQQLEEEKLYLQQEVGSGYSYSDIIGSGEEMQKVFHLLSQVSFANSTVLILGETGTGKELVARAIHNGSPRKDKLMVKVNCAALPANLIESELFGHERGSFTGATERRIGKFELANHGTLFLDEIGEMPLDLQVKLLRAIQEKEIERVGGKTTIRIDVRIIAATNRDLQKEVDEGRFRRDLFYRLNVFPITLPPLRDRTEDMQVLVSHFVERYAKNTGKNIRSVSAKAMKELMAYHWPGNVRELEHLIERSVLMSSGDEIRDIHLPVMNRKELKKSLEDEYIKTFDENERDHLMKALEKCNGKIFGPGGAAELLGLNVSTLNSKLRKLNIKKDISYK